MGAFAADTSVSVERSRAEIETVLKKYGATKFASGWDRVRATVAFELDTVRGKRHIRIDIPIPSLISFMSRKIRKDSNVTISEGAAVKLQEQETRRRFRALLLVIKAKLEAVQSGVSSIEDEFLAFMVLPNGKTVGDTIAATLQSAYQSGKNIPLLPP